MKKRDEISENMKALEAEVIAEIRRNGLRHVLQGIEDLMVRAEKAQFRDAVGLPPKANVDMHTARLALLGLWQHSREVRDNSTSVGQNMLNRYRVRAMRELADDPRVGDLLRGEFAKFKGSEEGVFDN